MSAIVISSAVFACIACGVLLGALIRNRLSEQHLNTDAKDVVKLATALMTTLSALVLGLLTATANSSFNAKSTQVKQLTSNTIFLDQLLAQYGPETRDARQTLRKTTDILIDRIWHEGNSVGAGPAAFELSREAEMFFQAIYTLTPRNDLQRTLQGRIIQVSTDHGQARLALFAQSGDAISTPFLTVLIFWLTTIFTIFSLLTRLNVLVGIVLFVAGLSVSGSIFLILDLDQPFDGMMQISNTQLRNVLSPLAP